MAGGAVPPGCYLHTTRLPFCTPPAHTPPPYLSVSDGLTCVLPALAAGMTSRPAIFCRFVGYIQRCSCYLRLCYLLAGDKAVSAFCCTGYLNLLFHGRCTATLVRRVREYLGAMAKTSGRGYAGKQRLNAMGIAGMVWTLGGRFTICFLQRGFHRRGSGLRAYALPPPCLLHLCVRICLPVLGVWRVRDGTNVSRSSWDGALLRPRRLVRGKARWRTTLFFTVVDGRLLTLVLCVATASNFKKGRTPSSPFHA